MSERLEHRRNRFLVRRSDEKGVPRPDLRYEGVQHLRRMKMVTREERPAPAGAPAPTVFAGVSWGQIGPQPLRIDHEQNFQGSGPDSGEVTDIAIDPTGASDLTIFIATNNGGIWKTVDGGANWNPQCDFMPSLSMGAVAMDPVDHQIVYAGTGNDFDGGAQQINGAGLYRSVDAGETWTQLAASIFAGQHIVRIVLPTSDVVVLGTNTGVYRSVDAGQTFGANAPNFNDGNPVLAGDVTDLALDKGSSSIIYACINQTGIFVSTDGGITFPTNLFSNPGAPGAPFDQITFSQSRHPDTNTMYALVADLAANPSFKGLFKSTDKGLNWTLMPGAAPRAAENNGLQAGYDLTVGVDPEDPNRVYIGFQELYLSTDGGLNFGTPAVTANQVHFDHHAITFSPHGTGAPPTPLYVGTDGGIARSNDGGATWTNLNETIASNLFLAIDIGRNSAANNAFTYGGCQDTGTVERRATFAANDWHLGVDGDGGPVFVDVNNPLRAYGRDGGFFMTTSDGGANWAFPLAAATGLPAEPGPGRSLATPRAVDPNSSAVVYASQAAQLFRSSNTGASFIAMHTFPAAITTVATVKLDSKVLMVGCADGSVHRTANADTGAASVWTALTVNGAPPGQLVSASAIDPTDAKSAVVAYAGFTGINPANRTKHVFSSADVTTTAFEDVSGTDGGPIDSNLPDLPVHTVVIDPSTVPHSIIIGTDSAVLRSADSGARWQIYGAGIPNADCTSLAADLALSPPLIRVGTYGRSVFELQRLTGAHILITSNLAFGNVAVGASSDLTFDIFNVGSSTLTISNITDVFANPHFSLVGAPGTPFDIAPGAQSTITVRYAPTLPGKQITAVSVQSNDATHPNFGVSISGFAPFTGPHVTGVLPTSGPPAGGTAVQVLGAGFTGATAVMFGSNAATGLTVDSDSQISAVTPAGAGVVDVTVITPGGTTAVNPASHFTYLGAGTVVTGLNPTEGPNTGGTSVVISGTGFTGATQVLFGAIPATGFTIDSDSQITAVSPAGSGTVDVLVATPTGTSPVSAAAKFRFNVGGGATGTGGTGTGTGTATTTAAGAGGPESEVLSALADILRSGTDPEVLEAQRILLRRIALEGNVVESRIPPPKNITEIGGYVNLLGTLGHLDIRTQMLASVLGVAGPATPLGLSGEGPVLAFVNFPNDRPEGPGQRTYSTTVTVRSDMADGFAQAIQRVRGAGCALPLYSPPRVLPAARPGFPLQPDFLMLLGRVLQVAPAAVLHDPATDPVAIARRQADPPDKWQLVVRELDGQTAVASASWIPFQATDSNAGEQPPASRQYLPIAPMFAEAGWYPSEPVVLPSSLTLQGSLTRLVNVTGLVRNQTRLSDELSLLYSQPVIMASGLTAMLSWVWNGTTFVPAQ